MLEDARKDLELAEEDTARHQTILEDAAQHILLALNNDELRIDRLH